MEIDSAVREKLNRHLACLPPKAAIALLREVQGDELRGGDAYPHQCVIRQLIENLAEQGFDAEYLAQTWILFCEPFDTFLADEKIDPKQRGTILRKSVTVIWNWLLTELFPDQLPDLEIEIIQAFKDSNRDHARALMSKFHKEAGIRIWSELNPIEEGSRAHLSYNTKFGQAGVFEDALEMARVLQIAPALIQLCSQIQVRLTLKQDEDVVYVHDLYKKFLQSADDHVELGMLLIACRLAKPYEILKILRHHTGADLDTIILRDPASQSATIILANLEHSISEAIGLIARYEDFPTVEKKIAEFFECIGLFTSLMEISPISVWGNKIIQIRSNLSSAIKVQIEQLPRLINLLRYKSQQQNSHSIDDIEESGPNAYDIRQALYIANLLEVAGRQINQLSINDAFAKAKKDSNNFIEAVAEIIVTALAKGDAAEKKKILKYFNPIVELTLILQGRELASLLERRGESALRAQPAAQTVSS
jgi:hypothetical protein